jgi:hypothetical protein
MVKGYVSDGLLAVIEFEMCLETPVLAQVSKLMNLGWCLLWESLIVLDLKEPRQDHLHQTDDE